MCKCIKYVRKNLMLLSVLKLMVGITSITYKHTFTTINLVDRTRSWPNVCSDLNFAVEFVQNALFNWRKSTLVLRAPFPSAVLVNISATNFVGVGLNWECNELGASKNVLRCCFACALHCPVIITTKIGTFEEEWGRK